MALRFGYWILFFYLVLCGHTNGVRDVVNKPNPYITGYINAKEMNQQPYKTGYGDSQEMKQPYITGYINNADHKETKETYITSYIADDKEINMPYITGYIGDDKDTKRPNYITRNGGDKNTERPDYITQYGDDKEMKQPYITGYINNAGHKETKETYITSYIADDKEINQPYITGYIGDDKDTKRPNYITRNGGDKNTERPGYITQYGNDKEINQPLGTKNEKGEKSKTKCNNHMHAHSQNGVQPEESVMRHVHSHLKTQFWMSNDNKDRTEAFKIGFFTPDDLYVKKIMPLHFTIQHHSRFLPRQSANSIPFSKSQLPQVLQLFSILPDSPEARDIEQTLIDCSLRPITGEIKLCATSLESMVDFVREIIGSGIEFHLLSTTHPTMSEAFTQNYTVLEVPKEVAASKMVFCHPMPYPYAVFFCHYFGTETKVLKVSLGNENGGKVEAIAVCHMDTSDWDPKHMLFRLLRTKPGVNSPVCHFLPANHLVWTPSTNTVTI